MDAVLDRPLTLDQFIAWENAQPERHECHRGEVFARVGARRVHGRALQNIARHLGSRLRGAPSQACDRSLKFSLYRRLPSLQEYILFDPDTRRIEGFRRNAADPWVLYDMSGDEALEAAGVGCRVAMHDVFDGVDGQAAV